MPFIAINTLQEKEIFKGLRGRAIHTGTTTFMYWNVDEGALVPEHFHMHEQFAHVIKGSFELTIDGQTEVIEEGSVAVIPPNAKHSGKAITACELLDVFHPEREDYKF